MAHKINTRLYYLDKAVSFLSRLSLWMGIAALAVVMLLTVVNVIGRLFNKPLPGNFELVELISAIVVSGVLAYTALKKRHVSVDFVTSRFSQGTRDIADIFNYFIAAIVVFILDWQSIVRGYRQSVEGLVTNDLRMPVYPFVYFISFGLFVLGFFFLLESIKLFRKVRSK